MAESEEYSEVDLLNHAKELFSAGLSQFQANHEMCVNSGLFSQKAILEMDTCAISFRSLVRTSATKITSASIEWIDNFVRFCRVIHQLGHDYALRRLKDLGEQAKQVGRVFQVTAAWARDTAGRLHQAYMDTERETKNVVQKYKEKEREAQLAVDQANKSLKQAQDSYSSAIAEEHHLAKLRIALCWNLIALGVLSSKLSSAKHEVASDRTALNKAKDRVADTLAKFKAAQSEEHSVEVSYTLSECYM